MINIEKYDLKDHKNIDLFEKFFIKLKEQNENDIINVVDFLKSPTIKTLNSETKQLNIELYYSFQFERILKKEQKYNKQIADLLLNTTNFKKELENGENIILSISDGFSLIDLTKEKNLKKESSLMHHCVGNFGYYQKIVEGTVKIYSLRDRNNKPHVTFEYNVAEDHIVQFQGKGNRTPEKYLKYVQELMKNGLKISINTLKRHGAYMLGNEILLGKENYKKKLKEKYNNDDWDDCINGIIDCSGFEWFKKAPNVKLKSLIANSSGIEVYPEGFQVDILDQSFCINAKVAPNFKLDKFIAIGSGLEIYPEEFNAKEVNQSSCMNAKVAPNIKLNKFIAKDSGLEKYPEGFSAKEVDQSYCMKAKVAPNSELLNFIAIKSGLETYPENFKAKKVDQSYCTKSKIAPNTELINFIAIESGLETYPESFKSNKIDQSGCKYVKIAPASSMETFIADDSSLEIYPDGFKANYVSQKRCRNAKVAPNSESTCFYAENSGLEIYPSKFKSDTVVQNGCIYTKTAPNCIMSNFYAKNSGLVNYPINFFSNFVNDNNCKHIYTNYEYLKRKNISIFVFKTIVKYKLYEKFPNYLSEF
jgi:hypothetical protein